VTTPRISGRGEWNAQSQTGLVYHSNVSSKVFHAPPCQHYENKNCTEVFKSKEEALKAGYRANKERGDNILRGELSRSTRISKAQKVNTSKWFPLYCPTGSAFNLLASSIDFLRLSRPVLNGPSVVGRQAFSLKGVSALQKGFMLSCPSWYFSGRR
jgi:hypothetical protein